MNKADSSNVSRDEVPRPPRRCCSKTFKSKFLQLIIVMNFLLGCKRIRCEEDLHDKEWGGSLELQERKGFFGWWTRGFVYDKWEPSDILRFHPQVTIETPNYPNNYPNKAKCNWKIRVPAGEEVHVWCETFDILKGDFLRVSNEHQELWSYHSNPLTSDQGGDQQSLWIIWGGTWRGHPRHQQGEDLEGAVPVKQEEERRWLQMPGLSSVWIMVQILQWLPQIAAVTPFTTTGTGSGSG